MVGTKKSERILLRTYLPRRQLRLSSHQGFSLIEIAVVMVIMGLILTAGITFFRSSILGTKLSTTKTNLDNIKNSVINFAIANGRLPCSDNGVTPGYSNPAIPGACACANPPCSVPYKTLQLQLPGGKDSFGNVFFYDSSYDNAPGTGGLTNTTADTFCGVLYEYMTNSTVPPIPARPIPYVTDATNNGYSVAAVVISETSIDNVFNVPAPPAPSLMGKNLGPHVAANSRSYEMANAANGIAYGDLVAEVTYGDLYNKACNSQNTRLAVFAPAAGNFSVRIGGTCYPITNINPAYLTIGQTMEYHSTCIDCTCLTNTYTYQTLSNTDWNPAAPVNPRDGKVNANNTDH
ncbi:MAG: type II secretion system protein [Syntrophales bacterium]